MDVNNTIPLGGWQAAAQSQSASERNNASNSALGQQEFLHLLVAQMRNQDPINPLDGAEFAAQLAQFNTVEQLIHLNQGMGLLQTSQELMSSSMTNSMAASLAGKDIRALSSEVRLGSGDADVRYRLNNSASNVEIIVRSSSGAEVRREVIGGASAGDHTWRWDGRNDAGERLAEGLYRIEIQAGNDGDPVGVLTYAEGAVEKVRFTGQGIFLHVNGVDIPIGDVEEVRE